MPCPKNRPLLCKSVFFNILKYLRIEGKLPFHTAVVNSKKNPIVTNVFVLNRANEHYMGNSSNYRLRIIICKQWEQKSLRAHFPNVLSKLHTSITSQILHK